MRFPKIAQRLFGYDSATNEAGRRKTVSSILKSEDAELTASYRSKLVAQARNLPRNFSVAAWAIRKHLDFVSTFRPQARTGDPAANKALETWIDNWSLPEHFDVAGRHGLARFTRLAEARRTLDGDFFALKLADGRLQAIESDRVRDYAGSNGAKVTTTHGIVTDGAGRATRYALHNRNSAGGYEFAQWLDAGNVLPLGYYDRFDQIRGISPLAAGLATLTDVYEGWDYALAKAKVSQLFALAIYRDATDALAPITTTTDETAETSKYDIDFGRGPIQLDLDPGDKAEFLEAKTPPGEFQAFITQMLQAALKALDLPLCMYDEANTNFFGAKAAYILYAKSCEQKQADLRDWLDRLTRWRLSLALADGEIRLPPGLDLAAGPPIVEWIPAGTPWWNPTQEIAADVMAVQNALRTRTEIRKEKYGDDWTDVVTALAEEDRLLRDLGLKAAPLPKPAGTNTSDTPQT